MDKRNMLKLTRSVSNLCMNMGEELKKQQNSSPVSVSPSIRNGRRPLVREKAVRHLDVRCIQQIGAPRESSLPKIDTVTVMEWFQSIEQEDNGPADSSVAVESPKIPDENAAEKKDSIVGEKSISDNDEALKIFMQAWNQLDTFEEHLCVQHELAVATESASTSEEPAQPAAVMDIASTDTVEQTPVIETKSDAATVHVPTEALPTEVVQPSADSITDPPAPTSSPVSVVPVSVVPGPEVTPVQQSLQTESSVAHVMETAPPTETSAGPQVTPSAIDSKPQQITFSRPIPEEYKGPHYTYPITQEFVEGLMDYCSNLSVPIPYAYVERIVLDARNIFEKEPTFVDVDIAPSGRVIVVGDTHGQYPDLMTILRDTGLPSPTQTMVFNGDFVDRGPAGVEVLVTLLCLKLLFPQNVFMHRGNHELETINRKYNFSDQVLKSYDSALFDTIQDTFASLPLGSIIAKKVFVVHGGLPEQVMTLDELKALPKIREDPTKAKSGPAKIIQDLLWSDPRKLSGVRSSKRGAGLEFGADHTAAFLEKNGLDLVVRSHELCDEGYELTHDNNLMTIFSASYYCGASTNKGAFAVFKHGEDLKSPSIVQYYAQAYSAKDGVLKGCVKETLQKLREMIFINRHRLYTEFVSRDVKDTGKVSKQDWSEIMAQVLGLHIGWSGMLPYLAKIGDDDRVNYLKFLMKYKIEPEDEEEDIEKLWKKEMLVFLCCNLASKVSGDLEEVFKAMDKDGDGYLSYTEWINMFKVVEVDTYTNGDDNKLFDLMMNFDSELGGKLSEDDFKSNLETPMERINALNPHPWIKDAVSQVVKAIETKFDFLSDGKSRMKSAFRKIKSEATGSCVRRHFSTWLVDVLELEDFTAVQRTKIAVYVDLNNNGKISWKEFKKVFLKTNTYDVIQENLFKPVS